MEGKGGGIPATCAGGDFVLFKLNSLSIENSSEIGPEDADLIRKQLFKEIQMKFVLFE